jgi:hypothetical protein
MTERFAERELAALNGQGSVCRADGAESATVGAGLLGGEHLGLLLDEDAEGSLGHAGRGRGGDLLHRLEVKGSARGEIARDASGDDFSPAGGQVVDFLQSLR